MILAPLLDKVQMNVELRHVDAAEDVLGVTDDVLGISIARHLQLQAAAIVIGAQRPEMRLLGTNNRLKINFLSSANSYMHSLDPLQLHHLLIRVRETEICFQN